MNACSPLCGFCGACDDGVRNAPERTALTVCDLCGRPFASGGVTYAGVGTFCSDRCKRVAVRQHELKQAAEAARRTA